MNKMQKPILFFDMDNVLVDFQSGLDEFGEDVKAQYKDDGSEEHKPHYDDIPGIFSKMKVVEGAHEAVEKLKEKYDCYILSTAPWDNNSAWSDKVEWVKKNFDDIKITIIKDGKPKEVGVFYKRMILTHRKDFCKLPGVYLIDDRTKHGASEFGDHHIHFKTEKFPDWDAVVEFLMNK